MKNKNEQVQRYNQVISISLITLMSVLRASYGNFASQASESFRLLLDETKNTLEIPYRIMAKLMGINLVDDIERYRERTIEELAESLTYRTLDMARELGYDVYHPFPKFFNHSEFLHDVINHQLIADQILQTHMNYLEQKESSDVSKAEAKDNES